MAPTLWATTVGLDRGSVEQVMACFPEVGPALLVLRERDASSASRLLSDLVGAGYRWTLIGPRTAPETVGLREPPLRHLADEHLLRLLLRRAQELPLGAR